MIDWLKRANGMNPAFRKVCGFQPPFAADSQMMAEITQETARADAFDLLYSSKEVEIYGFRILRRNGRIKLYDIRFMASLLGYEAWLIVAGLIAVNKDSQLNNQIREAKRSLIKAIDDQWGIDLMLKEG